MEAVYSQSLNLHSPGSNDVGVKQRFYVKCYSQTSLSDSAADIEFQVCEEKLQIDFLKLEHTINILYLDQRNSGTND